MHSKFPSTPRVGSSSLHYKKKEHNKLMSAVRKRKPLWDSTVHFYKNKSVTDILWAEVARETEISEYNAKLNWRTIMEHYQVQSKKTELTESSWDDLNHLKFSSNVTKNKDGTKILEKEDSDGEKIVDIVADVEKKSQEIVMIEHGTTTLETRKTPLVSSSSSNMEMKLQPSHTSKNLAMNRLALDKYIELQMKKQVAIDLMMRNEEDDDWQFLRSLLPVIKQLPLKTKLGVRIFIQKMLYNEMEDLEKSNTSREE